jgi:hypothetical protein
MYRVVGDGRRCCVWTVVDEAALHLHSRTSGGAKLAPADHSGASSDFLEPSKKSHFTVPTPAKTHKTALYTPRTPPI